MTSINVICGGTSAEREVSSRSGAAVAAALETAGFTVTQLDSATASIEEIVACDVVFPVLHGAGGEDGTLQAQLDERGAKYVGSGQQASRLCFDKWRYRQAMLAAGTPMPDGAIVQIDTYHQHQLAAKPHVLKPITGGSSIDTVIIRDPAAAPLAYIDEVFTRHSSLLIEQLIIGVELTVGVLGEQALPVIEIIPPEQGEFDYENKYNGASQELCPPQHVSQRIQKSAQELALRAHRLADCRDLSRTDIMCDGAGKLYLLETNTIPGMTAQSLFPKMASTAGITMPRLVKQLVDLASSH